MKQNSKLNNNHNQKPLPQDSTKKHDPISDLNNYIASKDLFDKLEKLLPPLFTRQTASKVLGGLISSKTLSNLDSLGQGPTNKIKLGSKVGYERDSFINWLKMRLQN